MGCLANGLIGYSQVRLGVNRCYAAYVTNSRRINTYGLAYNAGLNFSGLNPSTAEKLRAKGEAII
jgi:hypothetical protein